MDHIEQFFTYQHLPEHLQERSKPFCELAHWVIANVPRNPERTVALRKNLEAKDAGVRSVPASTSPPPWVSQPPMAAHSTASSEYADAFKYDHLRSPLRDVSERFSVVASWFMGHTVEGRMAHKAIDRLLDAKDAAVRATFAKDVP